MHHTDVENSGFACPVAIVGIGCRFPGGVVDAESFWRLLVEARSGIREVPPDRWSLERYYHPDPAASGTMTTKWGGFVDDLAAFDARFFGISPREAMRMDPQQRWLLEVAWEAIEDAGIAPARLRGERIGVFVGISGNDYGGVQLPNLKDIDAYTNSGSTLSIASNRLSYVFDFTGPSVSVDTACSSSLVAVWLAWHSIATGTCGAALVGGVNALITPHATVGFSKASMVSPSGQCFAFDARANGYVRGEGAGVVFLKPLHAAIAAGDRIYAVIRAAAVNQDGHTSSMTVPSVDGQAAMLREAYALAGIPPRSVTYVEAHGTGTPVGDPIETEALGRVLGAGRASARRCLIGSVKTNIGHLEAGSGIAGLIKAALVLQRRTIPPSLNYREPNPHIAFADLGLGVVDRLRSLPEIDGRRPVVGVNSFGFGGTNAHVVLEAAPADAPVEMPSRRHARRSYVLPISARDEAALGRYVEAYRDFLNVTPDALADVCAAAGERKAHHEHRIVAIGDDTQMLRRRLSAWARDGAATGVVAGHSAPWTPPVFVFSGQGTQWWAMGRHLLEREPVFRHRVDEIDAWFAPLARWSIVDELTRSEAESRIDRTDVAQPAIFAIQLGLAELWKSWGVHPAVVIGHSVGEVAAAHCAGALSLPDAVTVIFHRSRLQHTTAGDGRMLVVALTPEAARDVVGDDAAQVEIAGINSPHLVTLAGDAGPLTRIATRLERAGAFTRWLRIQYAFHSRHMDPIRDELGAALSTIKPGEARIPFVSTVTGTALAGDQLDAAYWWNNVRRPVLFGPAIAGLLRDAHDTFLEIGPHPALESSLKECLAEAGRTGAVFHSLRRDADDSRELLSNVAEMYVRGLRVDWRAINQSNGPPVPLPRYPWHRAPFWLESKDSADARLAPPAHPLLGVRIGAALPTWQLTLDVSRLSYLRDHRIWDGIVCPASGYAEIGLALGRLLFPNEPHAVEDLRITRALFLGDDPQTVQVLFEPSDKTFRVYRATERADAWDLHAEGTLTRTTRRDPARVDLAGLRKDLNEHFDHERYCHEFAIRGYQFGEAFQEIRNIWRTIGEAVAEIEAPSSVAADANAYVFHPAVLDACFQAFMGTRLAAGHAADDLFLPQSVRRLCLHVEHPPARLWAHARLVDEGDNFLVADIFVYDDDGRRVADILGLRLDRAAREHTGDVGDDWCYRFEWEPRRLKGSGARGPSVFATTADILAATRGALPEIAERHDLDRYHRDYVPRVRAAVLHMISNGFAELGWTPEAGEMVELADFTRSHGIVEEHHRLTRTLLRDLEKAGWLSAAGRDTWKVLVAPPRGDVAGMLRTLAADHAHGAAEIELLARASTSLAAVLAGDADPLPVLFPGGSHELLERYYAEALAFPAHLESFRTAIGRTLAAWPDRRALRVLEVGAGTGSLTRSLLPILPAHRTDYLFTDVGAAFLAAARLRFADHPWLDYQVLDLEQDPATQGVDPGSFDLVVAADVLHATADVRRTLSHLRAYLTDGGLLMFIELVDPDFVRADLLFGLLKGWWRFADTDLRPQSPLLDRRQWATVLGATGFRDVASFGCAPPGYEAEHVAIMGFADPTDRNHVVPSTVPQSTRRYVIVADDGGVADALSDRLRPRGHETVLARRDDNIERVLARDEGVADVAGVIHCRSLDHPAAGDMDLEGLRAAQHTAVVSAFRVFQALAEPAPRVWFVTRNMYRVADGDHAEGLASAPLIGLSRVANNEGPGTFSLIDLDACSTEEAAEHLVSEISSAPDGESEAAYRDGLRYALRLRRVRADELPPRTFDAVRSGGGVVPYQLQTKKPGVLTNLALHETERRAPGRDQIEVRVMAGGLNFRDVMKALGTYPGIPRDLRWLGDDFSGVVERVGEDVHGFRPGDAVVGMAPYAFRSNAITDARMAFAIPPGMSFAGAATLPTVFLTAHYALVHLARMQAGERILIHAGAGGVGQAALQIARHLGLEIFATAGTPEKRQVVRDMGARHVMSSRTLEFADEVLALTGGRGVDCVLNSLAGDFIPKSLSVLAPFGRFLEIGKVDIYRNAKIGLQPLRNNISYFVVDLAQHAQEKPGLMAQLFAELQERVTAGDYRALPSTSFPITQAAEAFRFMAQAKHVGKVVLQFDVEPIPIAFDTDHARLFRADATYLVTGGAGGFGLEVARWIAQHGAGHLVLMSRTGPRDDAARRAIEGLRAAGVEVVDARGDVTSAADVRRALDEIGAEHPPLRGVFHAAMVLDDEALTVLDEARFLRVLEPKMAGAFNLHVATRECRLDHFVCFSSFSAVVGAPRQAAYNAGNAFLQALAAHRHAAGLPALTVDWGVIAGAGFVERHQKTARYLEKIGAGAFSVEEALTVLDRLVRVDAPHVMAARIDWGLLSRLITQVASSPTFTAVVQERQTGGGRGSLPGRLRAAAPEERARLVEDFIVEQVAAVFGMAAGLVDRTEPLTTLGLDSLMTVELVNRVERETGLRVPMSNLLSGPGVKELGQVVLRLFEPMLEAPPDGPPSASASAQGEAGPQRDAGHVVPLKATGDQPALIAFHPVGGGIGIYAPLARRLPMDLPLYGIESRLMRGADREFEDVETMVRAYVAAVRETTSPPFRLFGFSLGGYLAARVAQALEENNDTVDLVGVIEWDARPRETLRARRDALVRLSVAAYQFLADDMTAVRPLPPRRLHEDLSELVDRAFGESEAGSEPFFEWAVDNDLIVGDALREWIRQYLRGFGQHVAMLARELPLPRFRAPLVVWRANGGFGSPLVSWRHAGSVGVEHVIDGDHFAFLRSSGVPMLASQIEEFLRRGAAPRNRVVTT